MARIKRPQPATLDQYQQDRQTAKIRSVSGCDLKVGDVILRHWAPQTDIIIDISRSRGGKRLVEFAFSSQRIFVEDIEFFHVITLPERGL